MKTVLLLVLCFALACGIAESRKGRQRGKMQGRLNHLQFKRIKNLFRQHKRIRGRNALSLANSTEAANQQRPRGNHPFQKIRACTIKCQDECMNFHTCKQSCQNGCKNGKDMLLSSRTRICPSIRVRNVLT